MIENEYSMFGFADMADRAERVWSLPIFFGFSDMADRAKRVWMLSSGEKHEMIAENDLFQKYILFNSQK